MVGSVIQSQEKLHQENLVPLRHTCSHILAVEKQILRIRTRQNGDLGVLSIDAILSLLHDAIASQELI